MTPRLNDALRAAWEARWPEALAVWSRFVRLSEPRWCASSAEAAREGLVDSFAMIRLTDHAVVIDAEGVAAQGLADFPLEVMAHEIGHHVFCPGDLNDHARMIARMRAGLPTLEHRAGLVANLYADLLINDRLQRGAGLNMAGVYRALVREQATSLWILYMRIYELLWGLETGSLARGERSESLEDDAQLGAQLVRVYARDWLQGAGGFASLCLPYLIENEEAAVCAFAPWHDTAACGVGAELSGLIEREPGEEEALHPAEDPRLKPRAPHEDAVPTAEPRPPRVRGPRELGELYEALGATLDPREVAMRYYRERARPYLVRFPTAEAAPVTEPHPEGLATWEIGDGSETLDVLESLVRAPRLIPGLTTLQRLESEAPGPEPTPAPLDLYIGIDCSGSMPDCAAELSYPVLAGTIMALSALRAGGRVMACLSGEPGRAIATDGFVRSERAVLELLTGYLGTGITFGLSQLAALYEQRGPGARPAHVLILSDSDIFYGLPDTPCVRPGPWAAGWTVARQAIAACGGGGTFVLNLPRDTGAAEIAEIRAIGYEVHTVAVWEDVVAFAQAFSRRHYERK